MLDPAEEIRRLVDEGLTEAEARAQIREDLRSRQAVAAKPMIRSKNRPLYRWSPEAQVRGNTKSRGKAGRKSKT